MFNAIELEMMVAQFYDYTNNYWIVTLGEFYGMYI